MKPKNLRYLAFAIGSWLVALGSLCAQTNSISVNPSTGVVNIPTNGPTPNFPAFQINGASSLPSIDAQTGTTYTLALTDQNSLVTMSNSSANTVTVPANASVAFPIGARITVSQIGTGATTIAAAGGVTINGGATIASQYGKVELQQTAANTWLISGGTNLSANNTWTGTNNFTGALQQSGVAVSSLYAPITQAIDAQTGTTYTLILTDQNSLVTMSNSSANTLTVPANASVAFPIGAQVTVEQTGTGITTIAAAGGVTINGAAGVLTLGGRYAFATLTKTATNTWSTAGGYGPGPVTLTTITGTAITINNASGAYATPHVVMNNGAGQAEMWVNSTGDLWIDSNDSPSNVTFSQLATQYLHFVYGPGGSALIITAGTNCSIGINAIQTHAANTSVFGFAAEGNVACGIGRGTVAGGCSIMSNGVDTIEVAPTLVSTIVPIQSAIYTTSTIPAAASFTYAFVNVSDATTPTNGSSYTGGGSTKAVLWSNGTNWIVIVH